MRSSFQYRAKPGEGGQQELFLPVGDPDLVACYTMDEGEGYVVHDVSGNGHDLLLAADPEWMVCPAELFAGHIVQKFSMAWCDELTMDRAMSCATCLSGNGHILLLAADPEWMMLLCLTLVCSSVSAACCEAHNEGIAASPLPQVQRTRLPCCTTSAAPHSLWWSSACSACKPNALKVVCMPSMCCNGILEAEEACDRDAAGAFCAVHLCSCIRASVLCNFATLLQTMGSLEQVVYMPSERGNGIAEEEEEEECSDADAVRAISVVQCSSSAADNALLEQVVYTPSVCGNGILEAGEECDDGDADGGDGCSSACTVRPVCFHAHNPGMH